MKRIKTFCQMSEKYGFRPIFNFFKDTSLNTLLSLLLGLIAIGVTLGLASRINNIGNLETTYLVQLLNALLIATTAVLAVGIVLLSSSTFTNRPGKKFIRWSLRTSILLGVAVIVMLCLCLTNPTGIETRRLAGIAFILFIDQLIVAFLPVFFMRPLSGE